MFAHTSTLTQGTYDLEYIVTSAADGSPVDGLMMTIVPWMPAMGHGTPIVPTISALGTLMPVHASNSIAIQSITIEGNVNASHILAGYDLLGTATNGDASIGKVLVQKKWIASDLVRAGCASRSR